MCFQHKFVCQVQSLLGGWPTQANNGTRTDTSIFAAAELSGQSNLLVPFGLEMSQIGPNVSVLVQD